jgi:hypothetical protein
MGMEQEDNRRVFDLAVEVTAFEAAFGAVEYDFRH